MFVKNKTSLSLKLWHDYFSPNMTIPCIYLVVCSGRRHGVGGPFPYKPCILVAVGRVMCLLGVVQGCQGQPCLLTTWLVSAHCSGCIHPGSTVGKQNGSSSNSK